MGGAERTDEGWIWRGRTSLVHAFLARRGRRRASDRVETRAVGHWGEWLALRHLRRLGWDILARNWTTPRGEVDIVAFDGDWLVFVEVKTRLMSDQLPPPEEAVGARKMRQLERLALEFLRRYELTDKAVRFDLIAIETEDLRRFELRHSTL